jgi:hypothetical protein
MSTRSIIAKAQGDSWAGRYAHWDGYPSHQGASIWEIVQRDGWEQASKTFVDDHFYWSVVRPLQANEAPEESRWEVVAGYGIAGNTEQADPSEWYTPENYKDSWCEFIYVIAKAGLMVIRIYDDKILGFFRWEDPEPNWVQVQNTPVDEEMEVA